MVEERTHQLPVYSVLVGSVNTTYAPRIVLNMTPQVLLRHVDICVQQVDVLARTLRLSITALCHHYPHVGAVLACSNAALHDAGPLPASPEPLPRRLSVSCVQPLNHSWAGDDKCGLVLVVVGSINGHSDERAYPVPRGQRSRRV